MKSVIVIGGGVAGLAAACALAEEGFAVTLIEKRASLGGRAGSFIDGESGERIDNCQHVTMRCCTNLEDFYRRVGVADRIRWFETVLFWDEQGRTSEIHGSWLPAPLHTLPSFLTFKALGLRDKIAIATGFLRILRARPVPALDEISIGDWLERTGQPKRAIDRFWRPVLVSACNEDLDRISCAHAFKIFRDGFLANAQAYEMGLPTVRLADLYTEPGVRYVEQRGGQVRCKEHVDALRIEGYRLTGVTLSDGSELTADYYVSALPFDLLLKLLPAETAAHPYFAAVEGLEYSPITGVHLWFDRELDAPEAVALLDREMQWIFNKSKTYGIWRWALGPGSSEPAQCVQHRITYLGLVVSSSKRLAALPKEEILRLAVAEVEACIPRARDAILLKSHVIKERKATFAPKPGVEAHRPTQRSPIPNLFLAGDWTATGWPATMEGAVRSGYRAAECLLATEGIKRRLLAPDLPPGRLARLLMRG